VHLVMVVKRDLSGWMDLELGIFEVISPDQFSRPCDTYQYTDSVFLTISIPEKYNHEFESTCTPIIPSDINTLNMRANPSISPS